MIALSWLVVEADKAFPARNQRQAILEGVPASADRIFDTPDNHLYECIRGDDVPLVKQKGCLHVVDYANTWKMRQSENVGCVDNRNSRITIEMPIIQKDGRRNVRRIEVVRTPTHGPPVHPGEMLLQEFLKPVGLSQAKLAEKMRVSYPVVNKLIRGKRGVTPDTALRLERLFGMEAQFWLNLQLAWDLYQVSHSTAVESIRKIKRITPKVA